MKKSTADHMHRKRRKNNLVWLFALLGILVLFLGTILAFLIFSNLSSEPAETVQEVSAVNGTGIVLPSHFTERKITDPSTARDAINDVADTLGIVSVEDELGTADCSTVLGDGKHPMQPRKHRSKVTQDTFMSSIHCPNRNGSLAQSHGSRQRNAASGKEVI